MSFGWLGTFREGQWLGFRSFVLRERADVLPRLRAIEAELDRIGRITVYYATETDPVSGGVTCSEERQGFAVSGGSSLEKLIRAYAVLGGNPFDVSLYLEPDSVEQISGGVFAELQPYGGVIAPAKGEAASASAIYTGGDLRVLKYPKPRTGGEENDVTTAQAVDRARAWVGQVIDERVHMMEARILKLCDLREQLMQERAQLVELIGGLVLADPTVYRTDRTLEAVVASIDGIFYEADPSGEGYVSVGVANEDALGLFPNLMSDILPAEKNTLL